MNLDTLKKTLLELKAKAITEFKSADSRSDIDDIYLSLIHI